MSLTGYTAVFPWVKGSNRTLPDNTRLLLPGVSFCQRFASGSYLHRAAGTGQERRSGAEFAVVCRWLPERSGKFKFPSDTFWSLDAARCRQRELFTAPGLQMP